MNRQDAYQLVIAKVQELEDYLKSVRNSNTRLNEKVRAKIKAKALDIGNLVNNI